MRILNIGFFIVCFLIGLVADAQDFEYPISLSDDDLTVSIKAGKVKLNVKGIPGDAIKIKSTGGQKGTDSRADGLAPVTPWPDNTGLGIHISERDGEIIVVKSNNKLRTELEISIPEQANFSFEETEWGSGSILISGIKGDVQVESNSSDVEIRDASGSIKVETTSGDLKIDISGASKGRDHEFSSVSGTTELFIRDDKPYSFDLSTVSGSIRTDFELVHEIEYKGSTLQRIGNVRKLETDLQGGGDLIEASTVSGQLKISYQQ